jgi:hypothetical protein
MQAWARAAADAETAHAYEFGLRVILDGFGALIGRSVEGGVC